MKTLNVSDFREQCLRLLEGLPLAAAQIRSEICSNPSALLPYDQTEIERGSFATSFLQSASAQP